jgi:hypothetical protein
MKATFLAAALAASALVAAPAITPAAAKDARHSSMHSKRMMHKHMHKGHHAKRMSYNERNDYRDSNAAYRNDWNRPMNTGFAPFDIAGNVVGGAIGTAGAIAGTAVGTAGAIAVAPFGAGPYAAGSYGPRDQDYARDQEYAYDYSDPYRYDGIAVQASANYAARNGFVCQPGTWFKDSAGRQRICQ